MAIVYTYIITIQNSTSHLPNTDPLSTSPTSHKDLLHYLNTLHTTPTSRTYPLKKPPCQLLLLRQLNVQPHYRPIMHQRICITNIYMPTPSTLIYSIIYVYILDNTITSIFPHNKLFLPHTDDLVSALPPNNYTRAYMKIIDYIFIGILVASLHKTIRIYLTFVILDSR